MNDDSTKKKSGGLRPFFITPEGEGNKKNGFEYYSHSSLLSAKNLISNFFLYHMP
jgi:hypothetical protein